MKRLSKEEFRHRIIQVQKKRMHLTTRRTFLADLYQSERKEYLKASSAINYR